MQNSELGDYVGAESCAEFVIDFDDLILAADNGGRGKRRMVVEKEKKEYPPPISPWAMRKYCTDDGRLVIKELKLKGQRYFEAHRENGRLVLNLVIVDDAVFEHAGDEDDMDGRIEEFECEENRNRQDGDVMDGQDVMKEAEDDRTVENELIVCDGGTKFNEHSKMETKPCGFGVAIEVFNPVHI